MRARKRRSGEKESARERLRRGRQQPPAAAMTDPRRASSRGRASSCDETPSDEADSDRRSDQEEHLQPTTESEVPLDPEVEGPSGPGPSEQPRARIRPGRDRPTPIALSPTSVAVVAIGHPPQLTLPAEGQFVTITSLRPVGYAECAPGYAVAVAAADGREVPAGQRVHLVPVVGNVSPVIKTRWAWCMSRSAFAVAFGMRSSNL